MPITVRPYIPTYITVHLGPPEWDVENVTVPFVDYIKNVASSEIYPTWEPSALRANILAQISFALNRVYTEFYPSRGYPFQITNSTAYDQKFIKGRNIFDSVSVLVDELFNDYIRRQGFVEPLAARFCNGTTSQCDGLSQWGSEYLAREGRNSLEILTTYYGEDIELVMNAPVQAFRTSYPGTPMR
ncbi:MAG: spore cortex-lytic protein, partial [Ruminiclostridium sp.]|nr:spore cortex-lytic protein [Ruminiclostridium sp.]